MPNTKRPGPPDPTARAALTAPSGNNHMATKPQTEKFTVHGADPAIVKWLRVYAAQQEQTIGDLFNAALREYMARHGEG